MNPRSLLLAAVLALPGGTVSVVAAESVQDPQQLQEQIRNLEAEIKKFQETLNTTRDARAELEEKLESNEKAISDLLKKIEQLQQKLDEGKDRISSLRRKQGDLEKARTEQQSLIARQIRAAYEIGNQEYLKVVLNQEDPNQLARMLTYYDYFNRARAGQIERYRHTIVSLEQVTQEIVARNLALEADRLALKAEKSSLESTRAEKQKTLVALNQEIQRTGSEIDTRRKDRERLEALLERITAGAVNLPTPADTVPFASRKGKLLLPIAGAVTNRFGSPRNSGKLRWNGVFIAAERGQPVFAVHYGRVVFSDWLRGFGLLLIIDHGDGYMSLYGHNQVLYRETGDWVSAGDTIATVGDSGGQNRSGLYFEIRHAGKPADPQLWCQARPKRAA
jgi:septal ring factor EnvC (AmiA/AmiB activator)